MALPSQIEEAARVRTKPTGRQAIDDMYLAMPAADAAVEAAERRNAALGVADIAAAQHPCELDPRNGITVCTHPDHVRDTEWARVALDIVLDLDNDPLAEPAGEAPDTAETQKRHPRRTVFTRPDFRWQDKAACREEDLALFFGTPGERRPELLLREQVAIEICEGCPVRDACLEHAFTQPERHGVWGGLSEEEREAARRRWMRRRASNRVDAVVDEAGDAA